MVREPNNDDVRNRILRRPDSNHLEGDYVSTPILGGNLPAAVVTSGVLHFIDSGDFWTSEGEPCNWRLVQISGVVGPDWVLQRTGFDPQRPPTSRDELVTTWTQKLNPGTYSVTVWGGHGPVNDGGQQWIEWGNKDPISGRVASFQVTVTGDTPPPIVTRRGQPEAAAACLTEALHALGHSTWARQNPGEWERVSTYAFLDQKDPKVKTYVGQAAYLAAQALHFCLGDHV